MSKKISTEEIIGKVYSKLTIIEDLGFRGVSIRFVSAICECGKIKSYRLGDIRIGKTTNCGCVRIAGLVKRSTSHGLSRHPLNRVWMGIKERCYYSKHEKFHNYGGRGIKVCDEWKNDFKAFYNWAMANGYKRGLEVDRWPNRDGNYEPSNCRITTELNNRRNTDSNIFIEYNGQKKCLSEWAETYGIHKRVIYDRIKKLSWPFEKAITTPVKKR